MCVCVCVQWPTILENNHAINYLRICRVGYILFGRKFNLFEQMVFFFKPHRLFYIIYQKPISWCVTHMGIYLYIFRIFYPSPFSDTHIYTCPLRLGYSRSYIKYSFEFVFALYTAIYWI